MHISFFRKSSAELLHYFSVMSDNAYNSLNLKLPFTVNIPVNAPVMLVLVTPTWQQCSVAGVRSRARHYRQLACSGGSLWMCRLHEQSKDRSKSPS